MLDPGSIAVVGASDDPSRIGGRVVQYLKRHYRGRVLPVNPRRRLVQDLPAAGRLTDLDVRPELAIVAVAAPEVVATVRECAGLGVAGAVVFSGGFAEAGPEGARWQAELAHLASQGIRICGPNCLGFINVHRGVVATFVDAADAHLEPGPVAIVSQSGALGAHLFKSAQRGGIPTGYLVSTGNEVDVSVADVLAHLVERPEVGVLAAFSESIKRPQRLLEVARRAAELGKPLLYMKAGRSEVGSRAALSHTGSLAGSDRTVDAFFDAYGVLRPRRMQDLLDWARALAQPRRAAGRRVAIVTMSGGAGIVMADAAAEGALEVPEITGAERLELEGLLPGFGSAANPVDCTGQVVNDLSTLGRVLTLAAASPSIDIVCVAGFPEHLSEAWAAPLRAALASSPKPLVAWCPNEEVVRELGALGIPAYTDPAAAIPACAALAQAASFPGAPTIAPPDIPRQVEARSQLSRLAGRPFLLEPDARRLLALYGVEAPAERVVAAPADAAGAALELGFPVALKALSYSLPHKSDAGGVVLNLRTPVEVAAAAAGMAAALAGRGLESLLVQRMAPAGIEIALGIRRDPEFGPLLRLGLGGRLVEILDQGVLIPAELGGEGALRALARLAGGRLLSSPRGLGPGPVRELAGLAEALSRLAGELPEVREVDLNPVIAAPQGVWVVDALVVA